MSAVYPWVMWLFATSFFAYQFIIRVLPGLIMPEIMNKFHVDATEFGFFSAIYYVGYAGMQIPIAYLLDRYGPRLIISLCCLICSGSMVLLSVADTWYIAVIARLLIGAGSAAGFLGVSKIISLWFPFRYYSFIVGLSFTLGLPGAIYGGKPVSHLMSVYGWENIILALGGLGLLLTLILVLVIKPYKVSFIHESPSFMKDFKSLFSFPVLLVIAGANLLMVGPLEGFADVWGVTYLMQVNSFSRGDAALITTAIFTGMLFGGPLLAFLADKFKASYLVTGLCGVLMALLFMIMLMNGGGIGFYALWGMMFFVGVLCCYQVLVFAIGTNYVPENMRGITVAFLNCINMLGGSFFHTTIGYLMDAFWLGAMVDGERVYGPHAYNYSLWVIPAAAFIGGCVFLALKFKGQKQEESLQT